MSLVPYTVTALAESDAAGTDGKNIVVGAVVTLQTPTGSVVTMHDDATGANPSTAKTTGSKGFVVVFVEAGEYQLFINGGARGRFSVVGGDVSLRDELAAHDSDVLVGGVEASRLSKTVIQVSHLKVLPTTGLVNNQQYSVAGFYAGSTGGGTFVYDATRSKSEHNGGTVIAPEALQAWDGAQSDLATLLNWTGSGTGCYVKSIGDTILAEEFGVLYDDSSINSSLPLQKGLIAAAIHEVYLSVNGSTYANVSVNNVDIRLTGGGTIHPFVRTANALNISSSFKPATEVTAVAEVTQTVAGRSGTNATKVTAPSHTLVVGSIVKLVSEDLIPSSPAADLVRNGEWGVVLEVDGSDIFLDRVLEQTYTTAVRIAEINDLVCDVNMKFKSTTGNATAGAALFSVKGFLNPTTNVSVESNDGIGLLLVGTYGANGTVNVNDLTDNSAIGSFGYGVSESGTAKSDLNVLQSGFCRHAYTTGKAANSDEIYTYGEPWASTIRGKAHGCSGAAFDTHEQGSDITFLNVESYGSRAILQYRTRRTRFINPSGDGNFTAISALNTEAGTRADGEVVGIRATNCNKPINVKDQSATGNAVKLKILGDSMITYKPTSTGAAIDTQADVEVYGSFNMIMTDGTDFNILASGVGSFTIHGDAVFNTLAGSASNPLKVNSDFTVKKTGSLQLLSSSINKLFTASSAGQAATTNIIADNMTVSAPVSLANRFAFPFLTQHVRILNTANQNDSTSRTILTTADSTELLTDALDPLVFVRVIPSAGSLALTSVSDGKFIGQQMYIENASSINTLTIPVLANVKYSIDILPEKTRTVVWEGTYWA
jgi:hypothetical protein